MFDTSFISLNYTSPKNNNVIIRIGRVVFTSNIIRLLVKIVLSFSNEKAGLE